MEDIHITEFIKLKDEQISRTAHRDKLFHLTLILIGSGFTFSFTQKNDNTIFILLLLPFVAFIAGMSHVACDRRISAIGAYFREVLAPQISKSIGVAESDVFRWEQYIDDDPRRRVRKALQFFTNALLYVGSGVLALGCFAYYYFTKVYPARFSNPVAASCELFAMVACFVLMGILLFQLRQFAFIHSPAETKNVSVLAARRRIFWTLSSVPLATGSGWLVYHYGPILLPQFHPSWVVAVFGVAQRITVWDASAIACAVFVAIVVVVAGRRRSPAPPAK